MSNRPSDLFSSVKGNRPFVLDVPYKDDVPKAHGAIWYKNIGWVIDLDEAPSWLIQEYAPKKYSIEDFFNGVFSGRVYSDDICLDGDGRFSLYKEQLEMQDNILDVYEGGLPGFLNASDTGTGKTITTVSTIKKTGARTVLVVAPISIVPSWRDTLVEAGDGDKLWVLINYESMKKLLLPSPEENQVKKRATKNRKRAEKGINLLDFDVVIFDECHYMANPSSLRSKMGRRIANNSDESEPAFQIWLSATYGKDPTKTTFLYPSLASIAGYAADNFSVSRYETVCKKLGIRGVKTNDKGGLNDYTGDEKDLKKFSKIVFHGPDFFGRRNVSKDDQHRELLALELSRSEMSDYHALWEDFVSEYKQVMSIKDKKVQEPKGLAVMTRFRQKTGILRAPYMVDAIKDFLAEGKQVAVSCEFSDTVNLIRDTMVNRGMAEPAIFTGQNKSEREDERQAFQRGEKKVIIFSVAEGINLQANEIAVGNPSSAERVLLIAEPRWSPLKMLQIEGRTQRNGELADAWYAYASGTIESRVINRMIGGMSSISTMRADSDNKRNELESLRDLIVDDILSF